nr:PDZ domain-containing protein [Lysinibacillus timonensis]
MIDILIEFIIAFGRLLINPLLYVAIIMSVFLGYQRVKRERKNFHIRILSGWSEFSGLLIDGIVLSLCVSLLSLAIGLTLPVQLLYMITIVSVLALILFVFHFLSPILYFTLSLLFLLLMDGQNWSFNMLGIQLSGVTLQDGVGVTMSLLAGLLLIAEGMLISRKGAQFASPKYEHTKRGLKAIAFTSKKIWLLPIFLIVPGDAINAYFPYWPQFSLGATEFSLILFPIVIGFRQWSRKTLPVYLYPKLGRSVLLLGELVVIGGLVSYFLPAVGIYVLIIGAISRIGISIVYIARERKDSYAVSPKSSGVMIAAVLPHSPAEKMGLNAGEVIRKVNGVEVHTEQELYEALQINAAHCRLEVLDHQNELRLTQHVVHSKDHHQVGLLLVD